MDRPPGRVPPLPDPAAEGEGPTKEEIFAVPGGECLWNSFSPQVSGAVRRRFFALQHPQYRPGISVLHTLAMEGSAAGLICMVVFYEEHGAL